MDYTEKYFCIVNTKIYTMHFATCKHYSTPTTKLAVLLCSYHIVVMTVMIC